MLSWEETFKPFRYLSGGGILRVQWNSKEEGENCVVEYQEGFPEEVAASLRDAVTGSSKDG